MKIPHSVTITMGSDNAAWQDDWQAEAIRNLRRIIDSIESGTLNTGESLTLRDINGNKLGSVSINP